MGAGSRGVKPITPAAVLKINYPEDVVWRRLVRLGVGDPAEQRE
jgi:hypothetical protein